MLKITPIQSKEEQATLCGVCNIEYDPECLAYRAYDDDRFLGMTQFRFGKKHGIIKNIVPAPGVEDFEAMFIMGRATMDFIDRIGAHTCICPADAGDRRLLISIGFRDTGDGTMNADMTNMFSGHCGGHTVKNPTKS
ncbi:MAG: hypothetical protein IKT72_04980 [Clostridia bacterium]|nr:hypothetical protein [Clostridia bacterium]